MSPSQPTWRRAAMALALLIAVTATPGHATPLYHFSVLNQHSPILIAEYWNPILNYVSRKAGVELRLKIGKTAPETTELTVRGEAQFAFTNHLFSPERVKLGWKVIATTDAGNNRGQIVTARDGPIRSLEDLHGQKVAFPSQEAFMGYKVPKHALDEQGIVVKAVFAGNQEGAMGQLKLGRVAAAGVNDTVMEAYAQREGFSYRILWQSKPFAPLAVMAAPGVPAHTVAAVRQALINMKKDTEGAAILKASAAVLRLEQPLGFIPASDADYQTYLDFYRHAAP